MSLKSILDSWDKPVNPDVVKEIITYMKNMPSENENLVIQCAEHIEKTQSLGAVLAVVHALNGSEFLLKCIGNDEDEFTREFGQLLCDTKQD